MWCRVVWYTVTDNLKEHIVSFLYHEDGGSRLLRNVITYQIIRRFIPQDINLKTGARTNFVVSIGARVHNNESIKDESGGHSWPGQAVTFLICIRDVLSSNLGRHIDYINWGSLWFYSGPPGWAMCTFGWLRSCLFRFGIPPILHAPPPHGIRVVTRLALSHNSMYHVISPSSSCVERKTSVGVGREERAAFAFQQLGKGGR
jgi:hypothetical protein